MQNGAHLFLNHLRSREFSSFLFIKRKIDLRWSEAERIEGVAVSILLLICLGRNRSVGCEEGEGILGCIASEHCAYLRRGQLTEVETERLVIV